MTIDPTPFIDKNVSRRTVIGKIADLLERQNIDVDEIGQIQRINVWQGMVKNDDGEAEAVDLVGVQINPSWADGPEWPVVQPAAPTIVKPRNVKRNRPEEIRKTVLLPDPQIGYLKNHDTNELVPMHDEAVMDIGLQIIEDVRPDTVINMGDYLDMSEWSSKFVVYPEFQHTTQPAIDRGHEYLAQQRASAGDAARLILLGGNHDDRLGLAVAKNAKAALRLRRADEPEGWPVLSIPNLLALDSLGVEYVGGYPAGRIKIADAHGDQTPLYALHGEKIDMQKQAKGERQSTVQGHSHHVSIHSETYEYDGRAQEVVAYSIGCMCRKDGVVPSTRGGYDDKGKHVTRQESWQHAVAILTETPNAWSMEIVTIHNGVAIYRDREFLAA